MGNVRAIMGTVAVGTQTSGAFQTGLDTVFGVQVTEQSATTTTIPKWKINVASGGTATNGWVFGGTTISGDVFNVIVYGR
jgi:hypothetical protein